MSTTETTAESELDDESSKDADKPTNVKADTDSKKAGKDSDTKHKKEEDVEPKGAKSKELDTSTPLGKLILELSLLAKLSDKDLIGVCYGEDSGLF